ncbi:peroxidase 21-like [Dioscorea cayenensis subsp. rotundata]|uniref:Peroxidase n=1 Tax=Dioscorea cayennensis subsp. rotundata TaxID=55577 RepID=A0AB40C7R6_DIOCR|nr:peroxidase 21-like [Dioscorea cayenensis subsp. rotundata]
MNKRMVLGSRAHSLFLLFSLFLCLFSFVKGELRLNFYSESCPQAEDIVKEEVEKLYHKHGNTAVSWVRNLFHDCMVKSCDASLLLEDTSSTISEQNSPRSFGMRNFKYVKVIKDALEKECPNTVSCADIVALSAREGVVMLKGPYFNMRTGRRDSKESYSQDVINSIPNHNDSLSFILSRFQSIGINAEGTTALFRSIYAEYLKGRCPSPEPDPKAVAYARNDRDTPMIIDNMYYKNLLKHKGLMLVDQQLVTDPSTSQFVEKMAVDNDYFYEKFTEALLLMSENNPVTGDEGEIRKDCRFVN